MHCVEFEWIVSSFYDLEDMCAMEVAELTESRKRTAKQQTRVEKRTNNE